LADICVAKKCECRILDFADVLLEVRIKVIMIIRLENLVPTF
jgi:hypothetical protein